MNNFLKKVKSNESIGIILLAVLAIFAGYMVYFQKDFSVKTSSKTSSKQNLSGYNYYDDYYDDYDYDDYYNNDSYSRYYNSDYYTYNDYYNDGYYYNDYYNDSYYDDYYYDEYYDSTEIPGVQYEQTYTIDQYDSFDPRDPITQTSGKIKVTYNNVNPNKLGKYTVVYEICNYNDSNACRTISVSVVVMDKSNSTDKSLKGPKWSDYESVSCYAGSSSCKTSSIKKPTATDPVTGNKLTVSLVEGSVNVNKAGTYVLIYSAQTRNGIKGTIAKTVIIKGNSNYNNYYDDYYYNDDYYYDDDYYYNDNYYGNYNDNYYDDYYNDNYYNDNYYNNSNGSSKFISNYEWTNTVGYTYRCDNVGKSGLSGWSHVSTDTSNGQSVNNADNHPTFYYNDGYYAGSLNKVNYYCKENCTTDLTSVLGVCSNQGETKKIYATWVGVYSGTVYSR